MDTVIHAAEPSVRPPTRPGLKVAMTPDFRNNPYQGLLATHTEAAGAVVDFRNSIAAVLADQQSGKASWDVLHLHWLTAIRKRPGSLLHAWRQIRDLKRLKRAGVGLVWTAHNGIPHESQWPAMDRRLAATVADLADQVIVHSEAARSEIVKVCAVRDARKVQVVHHGNYHGIYGEIRRKEEARRRLGIDGKEFVFLFLGAIRPHKGVSDLIAAWKTAGLEARLVIAGNIKNKEFERQLREQEKTLKGMTLKSGFIPDEELGDYLSAADVMVLPYQRSLTSGALVLAMSFGRPCIVPSFDTFTEFISDEGGFAYTPGSTHALAEALRTAVSSSHRVDELGERNLRLASEWGWPDVGTKTAAIYRQTLAPS